MCGSDGVVEFVGLGVWGVGEVYGFEPLGVFFVGGWVVVFDVGVG